MAEHTPTPWKAGKGPNGEVEVWGRMRMNASPILMSLGVMEHDPREANAAFIVKAVNAHDALVEALTDIAVYGCGMLSQPPAMNGPEEAWLRMRIAAYERRAREVLAAVKGARDGA